MGVSNKEHLDGSIQRYEAHLVAKGLIKQLNFEETFSPVLKPTTIHVMLSLSVNQGWNLRQLDVNNVFLNGILQK